MPKNLANAQELVEIEEIRESTVILKNGSLRQILIVGGTNFSLKSEEEQGAILLGYQNFLNALSFPVHIVVHSRKINIEKYLQNLGGRKAQEPSPLLQSQIDEYVEFIKGFVAEYAIMAKSFFVVVPFTPVALPDTKKVRAFLPFLKKKEVKEEIAQEAEAVRATFQENLLQLKQRVSQITQGLSTIGLEALVLNDEQLVSLYYNFYNPETVERGKTIPKEE